MESYAVGTTGLVSARHQVPDELMQRLHAATEHFSSAKRHLDQVLDNAGATLRDKESAKDQVHQAGRELDEIDDRIHVALHA